MVYPHHTMPIFFFEEAFIIWPFTRSIIIVIRDEVFALNEM